VITHPHSESESPIIGDFGRGVAKTVASDAQLKNIVENWSTLPEHIKLAIQALVKAGDV
jgi:ribosomal protein S15P/S13E